ncbi:LysR family transcriptional regulator [Amycolatopsis mediterranei]|uniref:LysR family transcriptional regulator n=1 Tax=Amycolatopsis mediterranei TaxID=33910 RepID=UPI00049F6827|nr:LysR family transcriptional regulator [Amycolatopsis mediterranei]KDO04071.1 LysR family transcriptional regulator [Amycolatopsis mediterranei]KDU90019.1 LysR family transcriptional regulator [Amycolatopsis mediterranei]UZF74122.1 LysR family transcriptional regulator [Amycolatopsis mediterranei]
MDVSSTSLRVLCRIAESGSFTAAAAALGYTQSAVSRQAAALERSLGATLFERRTDGVRLTRTGLTLLRHARAILASVDAAERELLGAAPRTEVVRLGLVPSAGPVLLPGALTRLAGTAPGIRVTTREGTTPGLARALRTGSLDLAVLTSRPPHRPPDGEAPRLHVTTVQDTELLVAAPATGTFAGRASVHVDELVDAPWIATPSSGAEPLLGVWPGLPGRARVVHSARDWLTKLHLVAGGFGVTTIPDGLAPVVPPGVISLRVEGAPPEIRRVLVARLPGAATPAVTAVTAAITSAARP